MVDISNISNISNISGYLFGYSLFKYLSTNKENIDRKNNNYSKQYIEYNSTKSIYHIFNALAILCVLQNTYQDSFHKLIIWNVLFSEIKLLGYNIPGLCCLINLLLTIVTIAIVNLITSNNNYWYNPIVLSNIFFLNIIHFIQSFEILQFINLNNSKYMNITSWKALFKHFKMFAIVYQIYLLSNYDNYLCFLLCIYLVSTAFIKDNVISTTYILEYISSNLLILHLFETENQSPLIAILIYNIIWKKTRQCKNNHYKYLIFYSILNICLQKKYLM